jgi:hypothetical protein
VIHFPKKLKIKKLIFIAKFTKDNVTFNILNLNDKSIFTTTVAFQEHSKNFVFTTVSLKPKTEKTSFN